MSKGINLKKVLGIIFLVLAITSLGSGGLIWLMNAQKTDATGFTMSPKINIVTESPMIVFSDHTFNLKEEIPTPIQLLINPDNFIVERWSITSNLNKNVFIGIAEAKKADSFTKTLHYKEANDWDIDQGPWKMDLWVNTYYNHIGAESAQPPQNANIWLASNSGSKVAVFEKTMVSGDYWVIIVNVDGSPGLNIDLQVGGKIPVLQWLPIPLLVLALLLGGIGVFFYTRKNKGN